MKRILSLLALLTLLSACAHNSISVDNKFSGNPVLGSTYLFSLGTIQLYQEDFDSADLLFRSALQRDPDSFEIRKQILRTNLYRFDQGTLSVDALNGLIDSLRTEIPFDEDMLNYSYNFYNKSKNSAKLQATLAELAAKYPSAKTYLFKVYYSYNYAGKVDKEALDKAYKLSMADPEQLFMIAGIYAAIAPKTAIEALYQLRKQKMSTDCETLLINTLMGQQRLADVKALFVSYSYPQDADYMANFLSLFQNTDQLDIIIQLANQIIATGDRKLLQALTTAAFVDSNKVLLAKIEALMHNYTPDPPLDSAIYAIFLADQLCNQSAVKEPEYSTKLCSVTDIDAILSYCLVHYSRAQKIEIDGIDSTFVSFMDKKLAKIVMPPPIADYLRLNIKYAFNLASPDSILVVRNLCANYMIDKGFAGVSDYTYAIQEANLHGSYDAKIAVMRKAIDQYPHEGPFLNDLGYTYLSQESYFAEAKALIQRALDIDPQSVYALDSMAWYYFLTKDFQKAVQYIYYPALMEDIPSDIALHVGMIYYELGEFKASVTYLQKTIDKGDSQELPGKAAELLEQIHQLQEAH